MPSIWVLTPLILILHRLNPKMEWNLIYSDFLATNKKISLKPKIFMMTKNPMMTILHPSPLKNSWAIPVNILPAETPLILKEYLS